MVGRDGHGGLLLVICNNNKKTSSEFPPLTRTTLAAYCGLSRGQHAVRMLSVLGRLPMATAARRPAQRSSR